MELVDAMGFRAPSVSSSSSSDRIDGRGPLRQPSPGVSTTASPGSLGANAKKSSAICEATSCVGDLFAGTNGEGRFQFRFGLPRPVTMRDGLVCVVAESYQMAKQ